MYDKSREAIIAKLNFMNNHDGFVVVLEDSNHKYKIFEIKKGLLKSPS